tara:strand:- start:27 stop:6350 length:6324 start_codon:yes stop_codon:yes gene_type:complete
MSVTVHYTNKDGENIPVELDNVDSVDLHNEETYARLQEIGKEFGATEVSLNAPQAASDAPQGSSAQPVIPEDEPEKSFGEKAGRFMGSLSTEVVVGTLGQIGGTAAGIVLMPLLGPWGPVLGYAAGSAIGGAAGSYLGQKIEGKSAAKGDKFAGRMGGAAVVNMLPSGVTLKAALKTGKALLPSAIKAADKATAARLGTTTMKTIGGHSAADTVLGKLGKWEKDGVFSKNIWKESAARGATVGFSETQLKEMIDEGRPAGVVESVAGATIGAAASLAVTGATNRLAKLLSDRSKSGDTTGYGLDEPQMIERASYENSKVYQENLQLMEAQLVDIQNQSFTLSNLKREITPDTEKVILMGESTLGKTPPEPMGSGGIGLRTEFIKPDTQHKEVRINPQNIIGSETIETPADAERLIDSLYATGGSNIGDIILETEPFWSAAGSFIEHYKEGKGRKYEEGEHRFTQEEELAEVYELGNELGMPKFQVDDFISLSSDEFGDAMDKWSSEFVKGGEQQVMTSTFTNYFHSLDDFNREKIKHLLEQGKYSNHAVDEFFPKAIPRRQELEEWYSGGDIITDNSINSLASYNSKTKVVTLNDEAIKADWEAGLPYIQGKGEGILVGGSKQKEIVMKDIDIDAFKEAVGGTWEGYRKFLAAHEYAHKSLDNGKNYGRTNGKKDWMHPDSIKVEIETNEFAAKSMGIDWNSLKKKTNQEVEEFTKPKFNKQTSPVDIGARFPKDQVKANYADSMIGFGAQGSSTQKYATKWGDNANKGKYNEGETVFVSVNGRGRGGLGENLEKTKREIDLAIEQGVGKFVADNKVTANSAHNAVGEGVIRKHLLDKGMSYVEHDNVGFYINDKPKPSAPSTKEPFDMSDAVKGKDIAGVTEPPEFVRARDKAGFDSGEPTVFGGEAPKGVSDMVDPKLAKDHPSASKEKKATPGATEEDRVAANNATRRSLVPVFQKDLGDLANGLVIYKGPKDNWEKLSMGFWSVNSFFKRQVAPSAALGPEMARMLERLKLESEAVEATSRKVFGGINKYRDSLDNKFKKGKHTPEEFDDAMTGFINGKGTLDGMAGVLKPIGKELMVARKLLRKQQIALIRLSEFFELDPDMIKALKDTLSFNNYHTDVFDIFLDPSWRSDPIKLGFALTERTISVYNQQVRIEIQAMEGGIPPADVEDRFKDIGGRFLGTDYKAETVSKMKTRQAAVVDKLRELAEWKNKMPSSTELMDAIKVQVNELEGIENKVKREGLTDQELDYIWDRAEKWANDSLSELEADSIHFQELKPNEQKKSTMTRALKKKRGVPYFQSQWMGKHTDPVKIFFDSIQTSANLAASFRMDADMMMMFMREAKRGDSTFGKIVIGPKGKEAGLERLETRTGFSDTEIHVEKWVNDLQRKLLGNDNIFIAKDGLSRWGVETLSVGMGFWKLGKTVFNISAYPTNFVGSLFQMGVLGVGITPKNVKTYGKGVSRGLREFNWIDTWTRSMQKESPVEYRASMEEFEKLKRLGILSTDLTSADVMIQDSRFLLSKVLNGTVEPFSKAYQVFDNAARYMVWQNYRNEIMDEWSEIPGGIDKIDRIAAEMTLATYQYYNRINADIKKVGKIGLLNPFVSFSADMARTMGNTTEMNIWKVLGDEKRLRKMFNINGGKFNAKKAKKHGYWGLFRMLGVVLGGAAYVSLRNKEEGFDQDQADAFSRSFTYSYDSGKPVVISIDKDDPDKFLYKNPEYTNPYVAFAPFATDLFNDLSPKGLADYAASIPSKLINIYGGEGPPVIMALWDVINSEVEGNPDPKTNNKFLDVFSDFEHTIGTEFVPLIVRDAANLVLAHPNPSSAYSDEVISLAQSFSPNGTRLSRAQILKRLVGIRENPGSFSETFSTKVRSSYGEYQDVMQDIHDNYEEWAGDQDQSDMHWAMRRDHYLNDKFASNEGSFDVIRGKMNTFLEDAKTMDHYKDEQLFEILKKSGASSDYQSLVMDAWNSNKSFDVPRSRYLDFVEKLTVGEMSELTDMDEVRSSIMQPLNNSPTYEALENLQEVKSRAKGVANTRAERARLSTADRIQSKGTTKDRVNRLIDKGIKVDSPEFNRLLKAGVVNGKIASRLRLAEDSGAYEAVGRIR